MRILAILVFIPLLSACIFSYPEYEDMDDSNRPLLENDDTLLFTDSEEKIDTMILFIRSDYWRHDRDYIEFMDIKYYLSYNGNSDSLIFFITLGTGINSVGIGKFDKISDKAIAYEQFGHIYFDVIKFEMPEKYDSPFENLWYSKKHGIVRYDMKDGESFRLVE